jgi:hypothetical protein
MRKIFYGAASHLGWAFLTTNYTELNKWFLETPDSDLFTKTVRAFSKKELDIILRGQGTDELWAKARGES